MDLLKYRTVCRQVLDLETSKHFLLTLSSLPSLHSYGGFVAVHVITVDVPLR